MGYLYPMNLCCHDAGVIFINPHPNPLPSKGEGGQGDCIVLKLGFDAITLRGRMA